VKRLLTSKYRDSLLGPAAAGQVWADGLKGTKLQCSVGGGCLARCSNEVGEGKLLGTGGRSAGGKCARADVWGGPKDGELFVLEQADSLAVLWSLLPVPRSWGVNEAWGAGLDGRKGGVGLVCFGSAEPSVSGPVDEL